MTKNLLVMTVSDMEAFQQRYRDLLNVNQVYRSTFVSVPSALHQLRAAMTEVDLDEILGEWINGIVEDGGKPFSSHVLAHMERK